MSYNWGPFYLVPTDIIKKYSGTVQLRETFDEALLFKELELLGISGTIERVSNPWYYRKQSTDSWIKIGESRDRETNFPVRWDTTKLENGKYDVIGVMHIFVRSGDAEKVIARQNVVQVTVEN
jgi:hypothetical protein